MSDKSTIVYKWDTDGAWSSDFSLETKFYVFGSSGEKKTIYNVGINFGTTQEGAMTAPDPLIIYIDFRTDTQSTWSAYSTITMENFLTSSGETQIAHKKLRAVPGIQLRIRGYLPESTYINDIFLEYRTLRKKSIGSSGS